MSKRGHESLFVVAEDWKDAIIKEGYSAEVYEEEKIHSSDNGDSRNDLESWSNLWKVDDNPDTNQVDRDGKVLREVFKKLVVQVKCRHKYLEKLIGNYKPDLIVVDTLVSLPSVESCGIPWIGIWSANPIRMFASDCPPADSGLPTTSERALWDQFQARLESYFMDIRDEFAKWFQQYGVKLTSPDFLNDSPYLNLYPYPAEVDYTDLASAPDGWFRLDGLIRKPSTSIPVPTEFLNKAGKKIYLSLGSLGSGNQGLMTKLIAILSKVPYLVLLSLGPHASQYKLSDNMLGEKFVNQLEILPHVDLVITHGGNNTVIECLHAGKPMIVLPIFGDQPDNAQRLQEKGLGARIDTFSFTEEQLLEAIERLINDDALKSRLAKISEQLRKSERGQEAAKVLEKIALEHRKSRSK